ncbi:hypothetical protein [Bacillus sp. FJAT-42315]|uniref:hypothetical protein n=1 Tax=Bacillus sp. FJAT-42315 TaxID=2014077 RepID=UPI000C235F0A|nr:hypothetical protein [Bacillus sp. FJAT-42315]
MKRKTIVYLFVVSMGFYSFLTTQFFTNDPPVHERVAHADKELRKDQTFQVESFHRLPDKEITLLNAYELGFEKAKEYDENPELLFLNSVDDRRVDGTNGKRRDWRGVYALPNRDRHLVVVIEKGKLKNYTIAASSDEYRIKNSDIQIDSNQIVKQAITQFELQPGPKDDPFSTGYHFRIVRDAKNIFISVSGERNGKRVDVYYQAKTGEYLGRVES